MNFNGSIKIYSLIYINKDYYITYKLTKLFSAKRRSIFRFYIKWLCRPYLHARLNLCPNLQLKLRPGAQQSLNYNKPNFKRRIGFTNAYPTVQRR